MDVPVTTILIANDLNFSGTILTAAGDAIDQKTACAQATMILAAISITYPVATADNT